ncbi:hypothetical protein Ddc_03088 [Ditylenchus destructor]|nr:hypothetical protein Ddc_03088 [Ditylenchus destructor]
MSTRRNADSDVPQWDEFNVDHDELDYEEPQGGESLDECGPSLPPGFLNEDSQECKPSSSNFMNNFSIPAEHDDEPDDPDPHYISSVQDADEPHIPNEIDGVAAKQQNGGRNGAESRNERLTLPSITADVDEQKPSSSGRHVVIGPSIPPEFMLRQNSIDDADPMAPPDEPGRSVSPKAAKISRVIGPALPPEFLPVVSQVSSVPTVVTNSIPKSVIGPSLPPGLLCDSTRSSDEESVDEPCSSTSHTDRVNDQIKGQPGKECKPNHNIDFNEISDGPCTSSKMTRNGSYSNMELPLDDEDSNSASRIKDANGSIRSQEVENEDDDIIGPALPPQNNVQVEEEYIHRLMEFEAQKSQGGELKREEWMTELPQKLKQSYGLSAKSSFNRFSGGASSSSSSNEWTKTPKTGPSQAKPKDVPKRTSSDLLQEVVAKQLNESRQESLLDIHQKKRKVETEDNGAVPGGSKERKPFNRESDMEVRGLASLNGDEAKARLGSLSSRFGSSSSNKFL